MNEELHVLLLEDNADDASYIENKLRRSRFRTRVNVTHHVTLAEGLQSFDGGKHQVCLLDLNLPDSRGVRTLEQMLAAKPSFPVIVVTGIRDEMLANEALGAGACDYITKGRIDADELMRMIKLAVDKGACGGDEADPVERAVEFAVRNSETIPECGNCGKVKLDGEWRDVKPGERARMQDYLSSRLCPACLKLLDS